MVCSKIGLQSLEQFQKSSFDLDGGAMNRIFYWIWKSIGNKKLCHRGCMNCHYYDICKNDESA